MENLDNKIITEHVEGGTDIAFDTHEQLKEKYESLQMKYGEAMEAKNEDEAKKIEEEMNHILFELGLDEEKIAA